MDFINHNLRRMNPKHSMPFNEVNYIPKKNLSELEQLNNKMIESMRIKLQNPTTTSFDPDDFQKMVDQSRGHNTSIVSDLTRDFLNSKKRNLDVW